MINVTESFLNAMHNDFIQPLIRGTVANKSFTGEDVLQESFRVKNQCVDQNDIKVGAVYVGQLDLIFSKEFAESRGDWVGKKIRCEYGLRTEIGEEFIPCPSYEYTINEATWVAEGLKIVAYDNMLKFDKRYTGSYSSGTPFEWLQFICSKCGVELGITIADIYYFANATEVIAPYQTDVFTTYRDILSQVVQVLGGFATMNREGKLVVRRFRVDVVDAIDETKRFAGGQFSDYQTKYTGLSVVDIQKGETMYYSRVPDDGLTMKLGTNQFLQIGSETQVNNMRLRILEALKQFTFTPFSVTLLGSCAYDLGDCIRFTGGIAEDTVGCIMAYEFGVNSFSIAGWGNNPALQSAMSKSDKNISGLRSSMNQNTVGTVTVTNIEQVPLDTEWRYLGRLGFYSSKEQTVLFHAVAKFHLESAGRVKFRYKLNSELQQFIHESYLHTAIDTATLFIPLDIDAGTLENLEIEIQSDSAMGRVEVLDFHGAVIGAGVYTSTWNGTIECSDTFRRIRNESSAVRELTDRKNLEFFRVKEPTATETFGRVGIIPTMVRPLTDAVYLPTFRDDVQRRTEDGLFRAEEDGTIRVTSGGYQNG